VWIAAIGISSRTLCCTIVWVGDVGGETEARLCVAADAQRTSRLHGNIRLGRRVGPGVLNSALWQTCCYLWRDRDEQILEVYM
jgi:hypothetical protein